MISAFFSSLTLTKISIFSSFTYTGSLNLQKNTLTLFSNIVAYFCNIKFIFLNATNYISASLDNNVTKGALSFFTTPFNKSAFVMLSMNLSITLTAERMTAGLL